jgi:hypothetical protein
VRRKRWQRWNQRAVRGYKEWALGLPLNPGKSQERGFGVTWASASGRRRAECGGSAEGRRGEGSCSLSGTRPSGRRPVNLSARPPPGAAARRGGTPARLLDSRVTRLPLQFPWCSDGRLLVARNLRNDSGRGVPGASGRWPPAPSPAVS